ncbi:MAG: hypothetical protein WCR47_01610, partial [Desulfoplanes sp.]
LLIANVIIGIIFPKIGKVSFQITKSNFLQILSVVPPIFVLLGLLDVWIDRSTMIKFVGKGSGLKGALIALLLGSVAAGPLYAAFPISMVMLKKRTSIFNVFIFSHSRMYKSKGLPNVKFKFELRCFCKNENYRNKERIYCHLH